MRLRDNTNRRHRYGGESSSSSDEEKDDEESYRSSGRLFQPSPYTSQRQRSSLVSGDLKALKEGLDFALGTPGKEGNWFPRSDNEDDDDYDYGDHHSHIQPKRGPLLHIETNVVSGPYSMSTTPKYDVSPKLELGLEVPNIISTPTTPTTGTINKFSDALARVSERIAGTGALDGDQDPTKKDPTTPAAGSPKKDKLIRSATPISSTRKGSSISTSSATSSINGDPATATSHGGDSLLVYSHRDSLTPTLPMLAFTSTDRGSLVSKPSTTTETVDHNNEGSNFPKEPQPIRMFGKSLKIFSSTSKTRIFCYKIATHSRYPPILLGLLILQVAFLSMQQWNPGEKGYVLKGLSWKDYVLIAINIVYTVEIAIQIIAFGLFDDRCMFEELDMDYPENELNIFSRLRVSKYLKPIANRWKGIKSKRVRLVSSSTKPVLFSERNKTTTNGKNPDFIEEIELNDQIPPLTPTATFKKGSEDINYLSYENSEDLDEITEALPTQHQRLRLKKNTFMAVPKPTSELGLTRAYLRNSWHRIDFLSTLFFWISLLFSINRFDVEHRVLIFRSLSCLRIIRIVNLTKGTTTILLALKTAIPKLLDVVLFIVVFWVFFGIIGIQSFKSSLTRHCVWTNPNDPNDTYINSSQYCGSWLGKDGETHSYIYRDGTDSGVSKGFRCPVNSQCISGENPYGGTVNFDNIFQSMEMVFVVLSANTFTDIMYDITDSDDLVAALFFIFCIFVMTVWLMNIFIAVIVTCFRTASQESRKKKAATAAASGGNGGKKSAFSLALKFSKDEDRLQQLRAKNKVFAFYQDNKVDLLFVFLIIADLIMQCTREADMSDDWHTFLYRFESVFTAIFVGEIALRFCLYYPDFKLFFKSKRNLFDLFLATITGIIILKPVKEAMGHTYYWLTVFQVMRFYRVVMAVSLTNSLWSKIISQIDEILQLALFYFLLLFSVSIIVARYFEGAVPRDELYATDFTLQTLPGVIVALYTVTSTENWTASMYFLQEMAPNVQYRVFGSLFFIAWFIFTFFVVIQIFIAIIATTLEVSDDAKRKKQLLQFISNMTSRLQYTDHETSLLRKIKKKFFKSISHSEDSKKTVVNLLLSGTAIKDFIDETELDISDSDDESLPKLEIKGWRAKFWKHFGKLKEDNHNPFNSKMETKRKKLNLELFQAADFAREVIKDRNEIIAKQNAFLIQNPTYNKVFWVIAPRHKVRRFCQRIVKSSYGARIDGVEPYGIVYELFQVVMILASIALVVSACVGTPSYKKELTEKHGIYNWTLILLATFVAIFSIEFIIKVLADGFLMTPNAYMREIWNKIDLVVLITIYVEFFASLNRDVSVSRTVAGFKALRTLRLLGISKTATQTFHQTLIRGFKQIIAAAMIAWCLLFPFSIWCLNVFNGRLGVCLDGNLSREECFNEYANTVFNWDVTSPAVYTQPYLQFDRFGSSISSLYEIISLEGWVDLLANVMASTGVGTPAQQYASPINGILIILFNFTSMVFILTLFVSVIVNNYSKISGKAYLTPEQIGWYQVKSILGQVRPSHRKNLTKMKWYNRICYKITVEKSSWWKDFLSIVLGLHVLALMMEIFPTNDGLDIFRFFIYICASGIFTINSAISILGYGFWEFFGNKWNVFSTIISIGALITTVIANFVNSQSFFVNFNKLFLVGMLSFIIPRSDKLSQLFRFASSGLPSLLALMYTWGIMFLMFAIALNQLFGLTKIGPNGTGNLNVRSAPKALILLFRCSFGEGWNYIMDDYTIKWPYCTPGASAQDGDCGNAAYAYILFIAWNILSMYIFLNLFISVILDSFSFIGNSKVYGHLIEREEIRKFKTSWQAFDPEGTGFISPEDLPKFLQTLDGALSFHFYGGQLSIPSLCKEWITRNNPDDPYDITLHYDVIEEILNQTDVQKIRARRKLYDQFVEEAMTSMVLNNEVGISFQRIILQIPLYSAFNDGECLNLIDYLERRFLMQRVQKHLNKRRVIDIMTGYAIRWKYLQNKLKGIRDVDIDFGSALRKRVSIFNPRSSMELDNDNDDDDDNDDDIDDDDTYSQTHLLPSTSKPQTQERTSVPKIIISNADVESLSTGDYVPRAPINLFKGNDTPSGLTELIANRQQSWEHVTMGTHSSSWGNVFADQASDDGDGEEEDEKKEHYI
ncbi:calcium channel protein [Scheffersomyces spartinae]|uniref:Calcium-channel protein CCH1 n=1 Tax=Scheffersomyces spartinae TaxID=45513 RepID=A0A9P8AK70_9ASCO|nr:calcium channel protein [Scheffersomyces spartinae]KAG7195586.1 calcium channel protein [Scheffersomyces spartinae]